MASAGVGNPRF